MGGQYRRSKVKCRYIILMIVISLLLCACQINPEAHAVISKNDGSFDANSIVSASDYYDVYPQSIIYWDKFTSTDNSV